MKQRLILFFFEFFPGGKILGCEYEVLDEWFKFVSDKESSLNLNVEHSGSVASFGNRITIDFDDISIFTSSLEFSWRQNSKWLSFPTIGPPFPDGPIAKFPVN